MTTAPLDPISSAALDQWAGGAVTELLERAALTSPMLTPSASSEPTPAMTGGPRRPVRRRLAVSVGVAVALAVAAVVVGLVVAPTSSTVRLKPAHVVPTLSEAPGRYENVATEYVEPAWWPNSLRSPIEVRGIGSWTNGDSWLIRRGGVVVGVASMEKNDAQLGRDPSGQMIVADPSDGALLSASIQLDTHTLLRVSSSQLSATEVNGLTSGFDRASHTFPGAASSGLVATLDPDAWITTAAQSPDIFTTVTRWSGRAGDSRQLGVGGRKVSDAATVVTAIGQYTSGSTATSVGSSPAVLLPAAGGRTQLFWAVSPTVLGMADAQDMSTADIIHAAGSTAVVPRSWWWALRHRKPAKRTVHGFRVADTDAYVTSGSLGPYRWLVTQSVDGLFLNYLDRRGHSMGGEGRFGTTTQSVQPALSLGMASGGPTAAISLNLPHGAHDVKVTINGVRVASALFHLPGTDVDKVIAIGKDPSYDPSTTLGADPISAVPSEHATVTATLPDGSPYAASI